MSYESPWCRSTERPTLNSEKSVKTKVIIESILQVFDFLYKDTHYYLSRKFNKYSHYVDTEVTQLIAEYRNAQEVNVNESNNPPKSSEHPEIQDENVR